MFDAYSAPKSAKQHQGGYKLIQNLQAALRQAARPSAYLTAARQRGAVSLPKSIFYQHTFRVGWRGFDPLPFEFHYTSKLRKLHVQFISCNMNVQTWSPTRTPFNLLPTRSTTRSPS